jgi:AraC family transcriptional regulator of adaptative response/methylated-DNA-[protein]-cysteine methyltransferase
MDIQNKIHYERIAKAIDFIKQNFKQQPKLDEIAQFVSISPSHFQRLFTEWAGTSPKKFLQYISIEHAKKILKDGNSSLLDTTIKTGLSSTSRLHDLFITIEGMTPAEFKSGGKNLEIEYSYSNSPFGNIFIASTSKGICHLTFEKDKIIALENLKAKYPNAIFMEYNNCLHQNALLIFKNDWTELQKIKLHLKGTDFQLKVWESLLSIPFGQLSTYSSVAKNIGNPKASRAVGTAIGNNPIAFLIPCHRVIKSTGKFDGYHWGTTRKTAIIGWEQSKINL